MKNNFPYKINKVALEKKLVQVKKESQKIKRMRSIQTFALYFVSISVPIMYVFYLVKSSGLMKNLEIDKKIINRKKKIENSFGIDVQANENKIKEFNKKRAINSGRLEFEEKLKYGNKELNQREEPLQKAEIESDKNKDKNYEEDNFNLKKYKKVEIENLNMEKLKIKNTTNPLNLENNVFFDSPWKQIKKPL